MSEPSSSHNNEGTRTGHVRAAHADSSGGECAGVRGNRPCAGAERVAESPKERGQTDLFKTRCFKTRGGEAAKQARRRGCREYGADADRPVRHLGGLYRDAKRQEGVLRARQTFVVENQSGEPPARSGLRLRL